MSDPLNQAKPTPFDPEILYARWSGNSCSSTETRKHVLRCLAFPEPLNGVTPEKKELTSHNEKQAAALLAHLLDGNPNLTPPSDSIWKTFLSGLRLLFHILFWPQPYLSIMQRMAQERLNAMEASLEHLNTSDNSAEERADTELWIEHQKNALLCLFAYMQPKEGTLLSLPCKLANGRWEMASYTLEHLCLTPRLGNSPYVAYGLMPEKASDPECQASPHMLYMGTCLPGWRGYLWTFITDTLPLTSVGESMFWMGKNTIHAFLDKGMKLTGRKTECHGQSLGGSLSLHTAHAFPTLCEAFANAPAGTHKPRTLQTRAMILCRGIDPVTRFGQIPTGDKVTYGYEGMIKTDEGDDNHPIHSHGPRYNHLASLSFQNQASILRVKHSFFNQGAYNTTLNHLLKLSSFIIFPLALCFKILLVPFYLTAQLIKSTVSLFQKAPAPTSSDRAVVGFSSVHTERTHTPRRTFLPSLQKKDLSAKPSVSFFSRLFCFK